MAAKILHSLTDDNPDLQKQIGCMTGVFQLFDRHQIVAGRRFSGQSPNRLPPGSPHFDYGTPERESGSSYQRPYIMEKYSNKIVQDKNRASTESSRDSFSSMSRSSSFSSLDCNINKTTHHEPDQTVFPETPSRDSLTRQSRQSVDLRDVVKDSMYRHKPTVKDDGPNHVVDYRESLDALAKFQESNWCYNEPRELSRSKSYQLKDGSLLSIPKDCPRFSYDGRETNRFSFQSLDNSRKVISEELQRHSLDSRESSTRGLRNPKSDDVISANRGPIQSRPPSVVAKLMGLEALPDSSSANQKESGFRDNQNASDVFGPIKMHNSSRSSQIESASTLWRNYDIKPVPRFPIEPAPWKQCDGVGIPQRPVSRAMKSPTRIHSPSVYSEVDDKRLKDLEFTESGKDLRALKQILEAMQSIETRTRPVSTQNERFLDRQNRRESNNFRAYESSIVIMKPAKVVERLSRPVDEFPMDDRKIFRNDIPKSTRRENTANASEVKNGGRHTRTTPGKSSGSVSPRLAQKRPELERRSRPPTPPLDSSKLRKQSAKQGSESSSPVGRRSKYSNMQQNDGQHREVKGKSKKLSYRETQVSHEVVNISEFSEEIDNMQSPISIQEKSTLHVREHELLGPEYPSPVSVLDGGIYRDDSPSPVKHKLKTLQDDADQGIKDQWQAPDDVIPDTLSSGITSEINRKKLQDIEHLVQKLTRLNSGHIASLCENTKPDDMYISEILLASGLLLRDLGSNLTTFPFHSSGHPINPELFFVLEQTKFNSSTKQEPKKIIRKEKIHRKLIFDSVNEILAGKLALAVPFQKLVKKTFNAQKLLRDLCLEIEQLQVNKKKEDVSLEEEDDGSKGVLWEEVLNRAESWTDYDGEIPVITMEVERLIFKDLVNEVVLGEAADGRRMKPGRRCRQLFSK